MKYAFPPFDPFPPVHWGWIALQVGQLALLFGALVILYRKKRRPAQWYDLLLWLGAGAVCTIILMYTIENLARSVSYVAADRYVTVSLWLTWMAAIGGCALSSVRLIKLGQAGDITYAILMLPVILLIIALLLPPVTSSRTLTFRSQCKNNLKQIGLALHNYHEVFEQFPLPAPGEPPISWRVSLLPFVDGAALYREYDPEQAWNDPPNDQLARQPFHAYLCPSNPELKDAADRYYTAYAFAVGERSFIQRDRPATFRIADADGLSNTALVMEACGARIVWTEPRDVEVNKESLGINLPGRERGHSPAILSSYHTGGAQLLMADGAVRFVSSNLAPEILESLLDPDDGGPAEF